MLRETMTTTTIQGFTNVETRFSLLLSDPQMGRLYLYIHKVLLARSKPIDQDLKSLSRNDNGDPSVN